MLRLLADEEDVYCAQIEVIVERQGCKTFITSVLASIKLEFRLAKHSCTMVSQTYHNSLPLVLYNMTRSTNFISTTKIDEQQLISWIYWLFVDRGHCCCLSLCCHCG